MIDSRMLRLILVSPVVPTMLVGPQVLSLFGDLSLWSVFPIAVAWCAVGFLIAAVTVAAGAWVLGVDVNR